MSRKEFVNLIESNIWMSDKLANKLKIEPSETTGMPRQQMSILVRLYKAGRAKLKDIALREHVSAPNLCATFRKLERDGFVSRVIDDDDRRNTWYAVTESGAKLAKQALSIFQRNVERVFAGISPSDETELTNALRTINRILTNME